MVEIDDEDTAVFRYVWMGLVFNLMVFLMSLLADVTWGEYVVLPILVTFVVFIGFLIFELPSFIFNVVILMVRWILTL